VAIVAVDDNSLQEDSKPKSMAGSRLALFWTGWTLALTSSWYHN